MSDPGFVPPPYPYERLDALKRLADSLPGGIVDCSIGTPCDPVPEVASRAAARVLDASMGYPASAGSAALRGAAAEWFKAPKTDYTRALFAAAFNMETAPEGVVSQ